jgi:hypothetical protein
MSGELLQARGDTALLDEDQTQELRRGGRHLGSHTHGCSRVGGEAAAGRQLEVELALATRKLDAGPDDRSVGSRSGGGSHGSVIGGAKPVQTIQAAVHLGGQL